MIRRWLSFIVYSLLIVTVFTNTGYAYTTKYVPTPVSPCSMEQSTCCDDTNDIETHPIIMTDATYSHCNDDCNSECSSQHQPALLPNFNFQSCNHAESLPKAQYQLTRYYHEPLLKPPMA
ncbi:hypothetical protein AYY19_08140 [Photobacterium aquimaris]|uniref:Uncharacterized protein n=1 Tax=Photobacterium aquimaris TaxID=512643 RepID=A0A2T3ILL4_9GAMM|nr:hypothetical protein [Photobacterium aquimaris]OBU12875.1 hypothetical protein AYY19_08140 [Photobacterium aquimaris]OBU22450.1 hypothetical protein AYY20_11670 [Photobacterium aquimaris]PSU29198.1 hypothetical protein CTM88_09310 [Photobacterium aquimaris]PSW00740.1 hypothetical protein CTM91_10780 [Photobacterium aquimaris]